MHVGGVSRPDGVLRRLESSLGGGGDGRRGRLSEGVQGGSGGWQERAVVQSGVHAAQGSLAGRELRRVEPAERQSAGVM